MHPEDPLVAGRPKRLYFKTYLQLLHNSVGSQMFRNFYIQLPDGTKRDALSDGSNSCAFFVSSVLTLFKKLYGPHGTVDSTVKDLEHSGWQLVDVADKQAGDVLVWEAIEIEGAWYEHIGFYLGDDLAVSTSWTEKKVVEHAATFGGKRAIKQVFRYPQWQ